MILVSYDGSAGAQAALDHVAQLMPGAEATVLTVWETYADTLVYAGTVGMMAPGAYVDSVEINASIRKAAMATATEGAERAQAAGLDAQPLEQSRRGSIADTILHEARDIDAGLIVMGTRGLGGVKSFLMGSVSHALLQSADRAVMVIPSPDVVEHRHPRRAADEVPA